MAGGPVPPELVIFDCDGVLVDSERLAVGIEARVLTRFGWPITPDEVVRRFMGRSTAAVMTEVADRIGPERARKYDEVSTAEVHAAFERELTAVDGVVALLERLDDAGVATCVASSGSHAKMRLTLGLTGLYDRFAGRIFSADEVEHGKPAPDLFLHAAARMCATPARCLVIEDSPYGVQAAVAAGMQAIGYAGGLAGAADLEAAGAHVIDDLSEVTLPV